MRKVLYIALVLVMLLLSTVMVACDNIDLGSLIKGDDAHYVYIHVDEDNIIKWNPDEEDIPEVKKEGYHSLYYFIGEDGEENDIIVLLESLKVSGVSKDIDLYPDWEEHFIENIAASEPTCTTPGLSAGSQCWICDEIIVAQTETAPALGHNYKHYDRGEPSCLEVGYEECDVCTRCESYYDIRVEIPATGHTPDASCKCTSCGKECHLKVVDHFCTQCNDVVITDDMTQDEIRTLLSNPSISNIAIYYIDPTTAYPLTNYPLTQVTRDMMVFYLSDEEAIFMYWNGENILAILPTGDSYAVNVEKEIFDAYIAQRTFLTLQSFLYYFDITAQATDTASKWVSQYWDNVLFANYYSMNFCIVFNQDTIMLWDSIELPETAENTAYCMTFVTNGADAVSDIPFEHEEYYEFIAPGQTDYADVIPQPTKTGYSFDGWYSDEELTIKYDDTKEVTSNITLYAKWVEETE